MLYINLEIWDIIFSTYQSCVNFATVSISFLAAGNDLKRIPGTKHTRREKYGLSELRDRHDSHARRQVGSFCSCIL